MGQPHLLVVEGDPDIRDELAQALAGYGHEVTAVASAADARREVACQSPDLILLDLGLPDQDGVVLCRALRAAAAQAVIVVLTARTQEFEVVVALDAGAADYLTKPFRLTKLLARLRAQLRRQAAVAGPGAAGERLLQRARRPCSANQSSLSFSDRNSVYMASSSCRCCC